MNDVEIRALVHSLRNDPHAGQPWPDDAVTMATRLAQSVEQLFQERDEARRLLVSVTLTDPWGRGGPFPEVIEDVRAYVARTSGRS